MFNTRKITEDNIRTSILVVDDESGMRKMLADFLSSEFKVGTASSADEALGLLEKDKFDIALIDVNMPGMTGLEFFSVCRKKYQKMQIMIMTGMPSFTDAIASVKDGAFYYLLKPLDLKLLHSLLLKAVKENKSGSETGGYDAGIIKNLGTQYRVVRSLSSGASGVVLLVEDKEKSYAMKVLHNWNKTLHKDCETMQRFVREVETLGKISNEHIVKIYDHNLNMPEESPYFIMEYVEGSSLAQCLNDRIFNIEQKISIILQIADALECVHAHGVIHRDIKPENILLTEDMRVKITDFGICHILDSSLTMADEMLGSPAYMAPESFVASKMTDARSDIFSLGVISYEMLTGVRPFEGATLPQIMKSVMNRKPEAPTKLNSEIPLWLQDVLAKMLNKNPDKRFQSSSEIIKSVNHHLSGDCGKSSREPLKIGIWRATGDYG